MNHPLFTQAQEQQQCLKNDRSCNHLDTTPSTSDTTIRHRFAIRTPPKPKTTTTTTTATVKDLTNIVYLSTAECLAYVLARIEQNEVIYHTIMKPLDLMVQQWQSYYDSNTNPT
jgi:hypothetical protein